MRPASTQRRGLKMNHLAVWFVVLPLTGVAIGAAGVKYFSPVAKADRISLVAETIIPKPGKLFYDRIAPGEPEGHR